MPRGRNLFGPGFWKDPHWYPGAGGYRGGDYRREPGWGPCLRWYPGAGPYCGPYFTGPEEEKAFLKDYKEQLQEELNEIEQRQAELNNRS